MAKLSPQPPASAAGQLFDGDRCSRLSPGSWALLNRCLRAGARYSVYFDNGKEVFVTVKSHEAARRKASRIVPGVKVRFSEAYLTDFLEAIILRSCKL